VITVNCFLFALFVAFTFVGCAAISPEIPQKSSGKYFITAGGGFGLQTDDEHNLTNCFYSLCLKPHKKIVAPLYLRTKFQNPTNDACPVILDTEVQPGSTNIMILSPDVRGFRSNHNYRVKVLIFDKPDRSKIIGWHIQYIQYYQPRFIK